MANRLFKPMGGSLTQDVVLLTGKWSIVTDATCDLTSGAATVTMDSTTSIKVGMLVDDTGGATKVPDGTTVVSVDSATQFTMSANATGAATNATLQFVETTGVKGFSVGVVNDDSEQELTLDDTYNDLVGVSLTYEGAFHADKSTVFDIAEETVSTDKVIKVRHIKVENGTAQAETNLNGKPIRCMIWLKNSSV